MGKALPGTADAVWLRLNEQADYLRRHNLTPRAAIVSEDRLVELFRSINQMVDWTRDDPLVSVKLVLAGRECEVLTVIAPGVCEVVPKETARWRWLRRRDRFEGDTSVFKE